MPGLVLISKGKVSRPAAAAGRPQVAVGSEASLALLGSSLAPELPSLGAEGFLLRTDGATTSMAVTGAAGSPRGALYGVHRLLERAGFDFLSRVGGHFKPFATACNAVSGSAKRDEDGGCHS